MKTTLLNIKWSSCKVKRTTIIVEICSGTHWANAAELTSEQTICCVVSVNFNSISAAAVQILRIITHISSIIIQVGFYETQLTILNLRNTIKNPEFMKPN